MTTRQQDSDPDRPNRTQQRSTPPEGGIISDRVKRAGLLGIGTVLLLRGLGRRSVRGLVMALVGVGVLARTLLSDTGQDRPDSLSPVNRLTNVDRTGPVAVTRSATIGKPPDELYEAWRDPDVFSRVMGFFAEVTSTDEDRHRWTVRGPAGTDLSWETHIVEDEPGEVVRWETAGDPSVSNGGSVRFRPAPGDRGTLVTLSLTFEPPGGQPGTAVLERLDVVPETLAGYALGRFKSLVESGEIATLEGNPSGRGTEDLV